MTTFYLETTKTNVELHLAQ